MSIDTDIISNSVKNNKLLLSVVIFIGLVSITAQTLLIRELLNVFSGNELTYGLAIFGWMILYACGSGILGRLADRINPHTKDFGVGIKNQTYVFWLLILLIIVLLPSEICLARSIRPILGIPFGMEIGPALILPIIFILLAPITIILGFLFSLASRILGNISRVYIFEAAGALLGGLLCTFILFNIPLFPNDSPYGRISILKYDRSLNFYENGSFLFSTADVPGAEEIAHLSLLQHPDPKRILLIGGGLGGVLKELTKYQLDKIDYVELDHKLVELAKDLIPDDRRISLFKQDGVAFINQAPKNYDAIIINLPSPSTANLNRFYTLEFFEKCKKRLAQNGILTFHLETSESYMGRELKRLNQSIYKTFAQAFKNTLIIPGSYNYFFGSEENLTDDRADLIHRWRSRNIKTTYFRTDTLYYILWPDKLDYVRKAVQFDQKTRTNTELRPVSYLYQLMLWSSHFNSPLVGIFLSAGNINFVPALIFVLSLLIALRLFSKPGTRLPIVIALLGFAGMATQMIIIYTFQSLHGYLYQNIGLLTAIFMAGLAIGAALAGRLSDEIKSLRVIIAVFAAYLFLLLFGLKYIPLYFASFLTALPVGAAFPLAVKIQGGQKTGIGKLAGILYGADLSGSAFAAILASIFFIPVYGIINTGLIAFLSVLCALAFFR